MKEKVMVLPGTESQVTLIKKLQQIGYEVLCVDPNENAPGLKVADCYEHADILDVERCLAIAKNNHVQAVLSDECDIAMPTIAHINREIGARSIGDDLAQLYTNKYLMRDFSSKIGLPCPKYKECNSLDEAITFLRNVVKKR